MRTLYELELQRRFDARLQAADQVQALKQWRDRDRDEELEESYLATQLAERLGVLLQFFASAGNEKGVAMRVWCLLYAVRPDLVRHEAIQDAADRFGVSQQRLCELLKMFKTVTGFSYPDRVGRRSPERQRKVTDAMLAARSARALARRKLAEFEARGSEVHS